jgi:hypothetical protein
MAQRKSGKETNQSKKRSQVWYPSRDGHLKYLMSFCENECKLLDWSVQTYLGKLIIRYRVS